MTERSRRFQKRLNAERSVLDIVNSAMMSREFELSGLTIHAIKEWELRVRHENSWFNTLEAANILIDIAARAGMLADNSRGVFESIINGNDGEISALKRRLSDTLYGATT